MPDRRSATSRKGAVIDPLPGEPLVLCISGPRRETAPSGLTELTDVFADRVHHRVAVWAERAGRSWARGKTEEAIGLKRLDNPLIADHAVDILFPYPLARR